ncbi:GH-E family nuclease [Nocardia sp. NPDC047038]|uniref:GH-E family nuclease n=1 Tax=Nocardia sp. NPDC047038 TaxID=3154338 RepID=UPI0033F463AC
MLAEVDPQGFTKAAEVYEGVHNALMYGVDTLTKILGESGGGAGSDNAGRAWSNDYDPAAWDTVDALGELALAVGQMHDLLQFTAANHANANSQSTPEPNPNDLVFPPGTLKVYQPPEPPAVYGGHDPEPTGWDWVKGAFEGELRPPATRTRIRWNRPRTRSSVRSSNSSRSSLWTRRSGGSPRRSPVAGRRAAAQGGMALAIGIYGARIAAVIRALIGLAEASRVPVAVSQAVARGSEALIPLIRARPALAGVDGVVAPVPFTTFANLRRPHLTQQTRDTIIARTRTWGRPGEKEDFYVVESEPNVKVPINKSYDDKPWVQQLPKTEDGKYYVDAANRSLYPVNPKWEFGHNSGFEHRRLLADAQSRGMTQKEFDDYVNSHPERFHIEDMTGNRSHRREQK